jgi:hypothetical protein
MMLVKPQELMMSLLDVLLGTWAGGGQGQSPTVEPFSYVEMITFRRDPSDYSIRYEQQTWVEGDPNALPNREDGQIRMLNDRQIEMVNRQGEGHVEALLGDVQPLDEAAIQLRLKSQALMANEGVIETSREMVVNGDRLHYATGRATESVPALRHYLEGHLVKVRS